LETEDDLRPQVKGEEIFRMCFDDDPSRFPFRSVFGLILPREYRELRLPQEWGDWDNAIPMEV
jgi:hypothetical protein